MGNLNKLDDSEKNIHAIWIGIPPKGEFDYLKVWGKFNPEYKIHIWTDSNHILSHKLGSIIFEHVKNMNDEEKEYDYEFEAWLKDEFYHDYHLKNLERTFDENVKDFLIDEMYASEEEINSWVKEGQEKIIEEQEEIKKYTNNQVILHDIVEEKDNIFPSTKYYEGYLKTLEHLHICAGASDRLRYAILDKFGGVYLDTDLITNFSLESLKDNQTINNLIDSVQWDIIGNFQNFSNQKFEVIMNQIILLDYLNQLNKEKIKDFSDNWEKILGGDFKKNQRIFQAIAKEYKNMNLNLKPTMQLSDFPITSVSQTSFYVYKQDEQDELLINALIFSKKKSEFLKELMKKIEATDYKLKDIETYKKLINKNEMIKHHTGPTGINHLMTEIDDDFYLLFFNQPQIANLNTINSFDSSWIDDEHNQDRLKDELQLKFHFWSDKHETEKYFKNYHLKSEEIQNLKIDQEHEERE